MIEDPTILTLRRPERRPTDGQIAALQNVPTGFVVDAMMGGSALDLSIAPMGGSTARVAGPAVTGGNVPGGILGTLAAIHLIRPGDVLVAGFEDYQGCAAAGDNVCGMARNAGAVGLVTDGPVRDAEGIRATGLPVWCTGLTPDTPHSNGPGSAGLPLVIGGQRIETGDMIVADEDGVVVIPFGQIDEIIERIDTVRRLEAENEKKIGAGFKEPLADLLASDQVVWEN